MSDDWETIEPRRGRREGAAPTVSVAARPGRGSSKRTAFWVSINAELAAVLGWAPKMHVRMQLSRRRGVLLLTPCPKTEGWAMHAKQRAGSLETNLRLNWLPDARHGARPVRHEVEEGCLVFWLPDWARPPAPAVRLRMEAA